MSSSVNSHESNPFVANADELKRDPTDQGFKKEFQTVGKPQTTDHNINDEYMRNAPDNLAGVKPSRNPGKKEGAYDITEQPMGVQGDEVGARRQPFEQIDAESTSVHPNNPVE
jgi:hypothetical protein